MICPNSTNWSLLVSPLFLFLFLNFGNILVRTFSKSTFDILMEHALLKRTSLINHKDSWCMHWTERVYFLFAFKKGRKHWGYLWVSNSIGMLLLITRVGVILMEPTEFPIALPNCPESCGDVTIPYPSLWCKWNFSINRDSSSGQPQPPKTGNLIATKRFRSSRYGHLDGIIRVSTPLTSTNLQRLGYASGKQYEIISQCSQFFQIFFLLSIKFL